MEFWNKLFGKAKTYKQQPENFFDIEITDTFVKVVHPTRPIEHIKWTEIEEIKLVSRT